MSMTNENIANFMGDSAGKIAADEMGIKVKGCYKIINEPENVYSVLLSVITNIMLSMAVNTESGNKRQAEFDENMFKLMLVLLDAIGGTDMLNDMQKDCEKAIDYLLNDLKSSLDITIN